MAPPTFLAAAPAFYHRGRAHEIHACVRRTVPSKKKVVDGRHKAGHDDGRVERPREKMERGISVVG